VFAYFLCKEAAILHKLLIFFRDALFFTLNTGFEDWILQELLAYVDIID